MKIFFFKCPVCRKKLTYKTVEDIHNKINELEEKLRCENKMCEKKNYKRKEKDVKNKITCSARN